MPTAAMAEEAMCSALYAGIGGSLTILWPNKDLPEGVQHPREGTGPWAAFHILHDGSDQATLGPAGERTFTRTGQFQLQIFVPAGQRGLEQATAFATPAINVFEGNTLDGVRFYRVGRKEVGREPGSSWYQVNVAGDFEFDETK